MIYHNVRMYPPAAASYSDPILFGVIHSDAMRALAAKGWRMKIFNAMYTPGSDIKPDPMREVIHGCVNWHQVRLTSKQQAHWQPGAGVSE